MRILVDTNVLLDVLCAREGFYDDSAAIWSLAEQGKLTGIIAAVSVTNIYYIIRRFADHRRAMKAMVQLRDIFTLASCDAQVMNQAIDARMPDFEDAVQYFTAVHAGAQTIVTRNVKHFAKGSVPVATPREFVGAWEQGR
ncbi:MAG: PIN domain-containing protein [Planctomycetes bacterium]|nr:PIN domain-containing protein [Planctomycetota bacterium]